MNDIDDRLRSLARGLAGRVGTDGVEEAVEGRARRRRFVSAARVPVVAVLVVGLTAGGWVLLSNAFLGSDSTQEATSPGASSPPGSPTTVTPVPAASLVGDIAFESAGSSMFVMPLPHGPATKIVDRAGLGGLSWSPDGSSIAFSRGISEGRSQIVVTDSAGASSNVVVDFQTTGPERSAVSSPTWSPGGDRLAFTTGPGDAFTVRADGSGLTQITDAAESHCADRQLSWSPDSIIVSTRECEDRSSSGIYALSPTGDAATRIVAMRGPFEGVGVSPDGSKVAFAVARQGVFVVNADGTGLLQLTRGWDLSPTWSPDGSSIAFSHDYQVWVVPGGGGDAAPVAGVEAIRVVFLAWAASS